MTGLAVASPTRTPAVAPSQPPASPVPRPASGLRSALRSAAVRSRGRARLRLRALGRHSHSSEEYAFQCETMRQTYTTSMTTFPRACLLAWS